MKFKYFYFLAFCSMLLVACIGNSGEGSSDGKDEKDTIDVETIDTVETEAVPVAVPPKKADELFDDFVYAFMHNKKFQHSRIEFPLTNMVEGQNVPIESKLWKHDPMYSERELYLTISPSTRVEKLSKDTSINFVLVQEINPLSEMVKQYTFERKQTEWKLTEISRTKVAELEEGADFMSFYCKFTTDSIFQMEHLGQTIDIDIQAEDSEERIDGYIQAEQWPDFAPELPKDEIMCVRYGKDYEASSHRIVNIDSPSGDAGISLVFEKKDGNWRLMRYKN